MSTAVTSLLSTTFPFANKFTVIVSGLIFHLLSKSFHVFVPATSVVSNVFTMLYPVISVLYPLTSFSVIVYTISFPFTSDFGKLVNS